MRALIIGVPCKVTARLLWVWFGAGNEIAEFWAPERFRRRHWKQDDRDGRIRRGWSVTAALRRSATPVWKVGPLRGNGEALARARELSADVLLSGFFTYLVPSEMLDLYDDRAINFHPALLPMYRGPNPRTAMILNGDEDRYGGVTMHVMSPAFDEGDVIARRCVPWGDARSFEAWDLATARAVGSMVADELPRYLAGELRASPQSGRSSDCAGCGRGVLTVDRRLSAVVMREAIEKLACVQKVVVDGPEGRIRVCRFLRALGPPTGEPPGVEGDCIRLDASDRRVLLRRWHGWRKPRALRLRHSLLLARTSPSHPDPWPHRPAAGDGSPAGR